MAAARQTCVFGVMKTSGIERLVEAQLCSYEQFLRRRRGCASPFHDEANEQRHPSILEARSCAILEVIAIFTQRLSELSESNSVHGLETGKHL